MIILKKLVLFVQVQSKLLNIENNQVKIEKCVWNSNY